MEFHPTRNRVIIYQETEEKKPTTSASGNIVIAEDPKKQEKQAVGIVGECGPECETVKKGDKVIYDKYSAAEVELGDKYRDPENHYKLLILFEEDISVILKD